jgi:CRISPR-associated protein Csb2
MFALEMLLLTGSYVATSYNDRRSCEWPPHPARLFSALVATYHEADDQHPTERLALQWLEEQGPPSISASNLTAEASSGREVVTVFVPVNDTDVLGKFEADQEEVNCLRAEVDDARKEVTEAVRAGADAKALSALQKKLTQLEKALTKQDAKLSARLLKSVEAAGRFSAADMKGATALFPEHRGRQPRSFPSIAPDDPKVVFCWPNADPSPKVRAALSALASRVVRVGHSSSLVRLRCLDAPPPASLEPDELAPRRLRVPMAGQVEQLEQQFAQHQETHPRVLAATPQGYRLAGGVPSTVSPQSVFDSDDWLVFEVVRPGKRMGLPVLRAAHVAEAVRLALIEHMNGDLPEVLSGHAADGGPSQKPHVAIVPLPWVGADHADGRLLGVAIVLPRAASRDERRTLVRAVDRWERAIALQTGDDDAPQLPLGITGAPGWKLKRLEEPSRLGTLQPTGWARMSRVWATATPVALDRNPGDLRERDPAKAQRAFEAAEATIAQACTNIGLPEPVRVVVTHSSPVKGGEKTRRFPRFPTDRAKHQRVLVHALIEFATSVRGPVLLGAGRYLGLGLLRPLDVALEPTLARPVKVAGIAP